MNDFEQDQRSTSGSGPSATSLSATGASKSNTNSSSMTTPKNSSSAETIASASGYPDDDAASSSSPNSLSNETGGDRGPDSHSTNGSPTGSNDSSNDDSGTSQQLNASSVASSTSPVRRLPSVLRPPTVPTGGGSDGTSSIPKQGAVVGVRSNTNAPSPSSSSAVGSSHLLSQQRQMYGGGNGTTPTSAYPSSAASAMNMRSHLQQYYSPTMTTEPQQSVSQRGYGHDRMQTQHSPLQHNATSPTGGTGQLGSQPSSSSTQGLGPSMSGLAQLSSPRGDMDPDGGSLRGQKRRLGQYDPHPSTRSYNSNVTDHHHSSNSGNAAIARQQQQLHQYQQQQQLQQQLQDEEEEEEEETAAFEASRGSHGPRNEMRYETWTSKQLRKKCSHLKLRGLKNVKKHVMVEALYRYYRNQRQKELIVGGAGKVTKGASPSNKTGNKTGNKISNHKNNSEQQQHIPRGEVQSSSTNSGGYNRNARYEHSPSHSSSVAGYSSNNATISRSRGSSANNSLSDRTTNSHAVSSGSSSSQRKHNSKSPQVVRHRATTYDDEDEMKLDGLENEIHVTSEDVIRLVDVVLSPVFVDRLAVELSRWQFWVDVREKYIAMLQTNPPSNYATARNHATATSSSMHEHQDMLNRALHMSMISSRNFKWSSMQLWEIWKELTFAYTKTCFEFTAAGMKSSDERDYINFCEGRPDVYYLHQRLHARPDLLHLIKSNEYIEEKVTSDASESIAAQDNNNSIPLVGGASPSARAHKRFKRIVPAPNQASAGGLGQKATATSVVGNGTGGAGSVATSGSNLSGTRRVPARDFLANSSANSPAAQEESGSTETSETTGEEGSVGKKSSNTSNNPSENHHRGVLAEQKYFGLLLQNFEAIFESLHNKKVLLAALRKDTNAPDHMIADLHDDIHVLSALKKEFRNKLRTTLG